MKETLDKYIEERSDSYPQKPTSKETQTKVN